jgi:hypothetical protein
MSSNLENLDYVLLWKDGAIFKLANTASNKVLATIDSSEFVVARFGVKYSQRLQLVQVFRMGYYNSTPTVQNLLVDSYNFNQAGNTPYRMKYIVDPQIKKINVQNLVWNTPDTTDAVKNIGASFCKYDSSWVASGEGPAICTRCAEDYGTISFQQSECLFYNDILKANV